MKTPNSSKIKKEFLGILVIRYLI